jgi:hypothetical protein
MLISWINTRTVRVQCAWWTWTIRSRRKGNEIGNASYIFWRNCMVREFHSPQHRTRMQMLTIKPQLCLACFQSSVLIIYRWMQALWKEWFWRCFGKVSSLSSKEVDTSIRTAVEFFCIIIFAAYSICKKNGLIEQGHLHKPPPPPPPIGTHQSTLYSIYLLMSWSLSSGFGSISVSPLTHSPLSHIFPSRPHNDLQHFQGHRQEFLSCDLSPEFHFQPTF